MARTSVRCCEAFCLMMRFLLVEVLRVIYPQHILQWVSAASRSPWTPMLLWQHPPFRLGGQVVLIVFACFNEFVCSRLNSVNCVTLRYPRLKGTSSGAIHLSDWLSRTWQFESSLRPCCWIKRHLFVCWSWFQKPLKCPVVMSRFSNAFELLTPTVARAIYQRVSVSVLDKY